ncbi:pumilio homolog 12-like [Andrographis paniculata]|uniref:pumilio homolog 12-like n=1 Tax=Andrographis paniculata TaxID=175694 RepID=UPI0021E95938|nr:pumilio homolog 12-like [Andrographis paniculata]
MMNAGGLNFMPSTGAMDFRNSSYFSSSLSLTNMQLWREELRSRIDLIAMTSEGRRFIEEELRSRINLAAISSEGRRFLEKKLEAGDHEIVGIIVEKLKHNIHALMVHDVANFVIRKLFEVCTEEQMSELLVELLSSHSKLVYVCTHSLGARAVQTLLQNLKIWNQRLTVIFVFSRIVVDLTTNRCSHHIIMHFLKHFHSQEYKLFIEGLANNLVDICTNKDGCSMIKKIITYVEVVGDLSSWELLTFAIASQALSLAEDEYGNCILQYLVELRIPDLTTSVVASLLGRFVFLSKNKFGSRVVEGCLQCTTSPLKEVIMIEIGEPLQFLSLAKNVYGKYVARTALQVSRGRINKLLIRCVKSRYTMLKSHIHGSKVLQEIKKLERGRRHVI